MRDEFERLIKSKTPDADVSTTEEGEYLDSEIQGQWQGYQMRQSEVDKLIEEIFTLQEEVKHLRRALPDTKGE